MSATESQSTLPTPREARIAAGFDGKEGLEKLARLVRRAPITLTRIERGYRPTDLVARRLARILGCDIKTFLRGAPATSRAERAVNLRTHKSRQVASCCVSTMGHPGSQVCEQAPGSGGVATASGATLSSTSLPG